MKTFATSLTFVLIASAGLARAQAQHANIYTLPPTGYGVPGQQYGFGGPVAGNVRHSSTAFEGAQRGAAARVQAQAQYNLLSSLAALNMAQVERMQMENKQIHIENFRNQHRAAQRYQGGNAQAAEPTIVWPAVLRQPQYAGFRKVAEQVISKADADKATVGDWERLQKATRLLANKLANEHPADAELARQFVADLAARGPVGINDLAGNN